MCVSECSLYIYVGQPPDMAVVNTKEDHMRCEIRNRLCSRCNISPNYQQENPYYLLCTEYFITQVHTYMVSNLHNQRPPRVLIIDHHLNFRTHIQGFRERASVLLAH